MERVAFLLEPSGHRLESLLNPESLLIRREAGLRSLGASAGRLTGTAFRDERLLATGGGRMELQLDLLFDTSLLRGERAVEDVTRLTRPFWNLAENRAAGQGELTGYGEPPRVRFIWGKELNIPGVVAAVAERLERFTHEGVPTRSWMRMRFLRVAEVPRGGIDEGPPPPSPEEQAERAMEMAAGQTAGLAGSGAASLERHVVRGAGNEDGPRERLDQLSESTLGSAALWRLLAYLNGIADPLDLAPSQALWVARSPDAESGEVR